MTDKVELSIKAVDVDFNGSLIPDFYSWEPGPIDDFSILLTIMIGDLDKDESYYYSIGVLSKGMIATDLQYFKKYIVCEKFDKACILKVLEEYITLCNNEANPYDELRKYLDWEYD